MIVEPINAHNLRGTARDNILSDFDKNDKTKIKLFYGKDYSFHRVINLRKMTLYIRGFSRYNLIVSRECIKAL